MAPSWFRFYSEVLNDPKVQQLSGNDFKAWVNLLCLASEQGPRGSLPTADADIGFALRFPAKKAGELVWRLVECGLIDLDEEARTLTIHGWAARQYDPAERSESGSRGNHVRWHVRLAKPDSDCPFCIAERVAKPIANRRDPDQIRSDTDTEQKQTQIARAPADAIASKTEPEEPPDRPFAYTYAHEYQRRHAGRPPPTTEHAAALALEREYGADACLELAQDLDWAKHPNYMRKMLQERRDKRERGQDERAAAFTEPAIDYAKYGIFPGVFVDGGAGDPEP